MSDYRDTSHSSRPLNWVRWTGLVLVGIGLAMDLVYFAGRLGWLGRPLGTPAFAIIPILFGIALIISQRRELADPAPELGAARQRWLLIAIVICTVLLGAAILGIAILGAVTALAFKGI